MFRGHTGYIDAIALSPDNRRLISGSWDNTLRVWDASTGREVRQLLDNSRGIKGLVFAPDGKMFVSGGQEVCLWDISAGKELRRIEGFELPAAEGLLCGARPILFANSSGYDWYKPWGVFIEETDRAGVIDQLEAIFRRGAQLVTSEERAAADRKSVV